jgi:hypothetical protein
VTDESQSNSQTYDKAEVNAAFMAWADDFAKGYITPVGSGSSNQKIGQALRIIRDQRLHRETHFNFYVYCARRFGLMPEKADFLISIADTPERSVQRDVTIVQKAALKTTCVYFIEAAGLVKIGYTQDLRMRMAGLQTGSPARLTLLATIPGDKSKEAELHIRFASDRKHGEWFEFSAAIKAFLENLS